MTPELKELNFGDLLILDQSIDPATYDFNRYLINEKHLVKGYCIRCEEKGCNKCPTDESFKLTNISHGSSAEDLIIATEGRDIDLSTWHNEGIIFLMEGPSSDGWGLYEEVAYRGFRKRPAQLWYWIHNKQEASVYPKHFVGREYGNLFKSIVFTFKLKNAYLTILVKCGLNNAEDKFKGLRDYDKVAISTCYENFLAKEVELVDPKIIFCFGKNVYDFLWYQ